MQKKERILKLTVKKPPFDVMKTGEKPGEYRKACTSSLWIERRLFDVKTGKLKEYDYVRVANGYSKTSPYFIAEYKGFSLLLSPEKKSYSSGFEVEILAYTWEIHLGKIVESGNYELDFNLSTGSE